MFQRQQPEPNPERMDDVRAFRKILHHPLPRLSSFVSLYFQLAYMTLLLAYIDLYVLFALSP
jgi:hypothetical protein